MISLEIFNVISQIQSSPSHIRNICFLAHIDHGKTTLSDALLASNGIISKRQAGRLRYLDDREDEQRRGITMKSSTVSLVYSFRNEQWMINLVDSPGHIDFSGEVHTATRICDGVLLIVDVVEGLCAQTHVALQQLCAQQLTPILIFNKMDRLILELKMRPAEAHVHLVKLLELVNAVAASFRSTTSTCHTNSTSNSSNHPDDEPMFSPVAGNVLFASAVDCWAFGLREFASVAANKLGVSKEDILPYLWGDFYFSPKSKTFCSKAQENGKKPLFEQLILESVWSVYDAIFIQKNSERLGRMCTSVGVTLRPVELRSLSSDPRSLLVSFFSQWLPLSSAVFTSVIQRVPSPDQLSLERCEYIIPGVANPRNFLCPNSENPSLVAFVSKMMQISLDLVHRSNGDMDMPCADGESQNKTRDSMLVGVTRVFSGELRAGLRVFLLSSRYSAAKLQRAASERGVALDWARLTPEWLERVLGAGANSDPAQYARESLEHVLAKLVRKRYVQVCAVRALYILVGRELHRVERLCAGAVGAVGGLEERVYKCGTLATSLACAPLFATGGAAELSLASFSTGDPDLVSVRAPPSESTAAAAAATDGVSESQQADARGGSALELDDEEPLCEADVAILQVGLQPARLADMQTLLDGLDQLVRADPAASTRNDEHGNLLLCTAGEVHLEKCIEDLKTRFAKVEFTVSPVQVPFRETIICTQSPSAFGGVEAAAATSAVSSSVATGESSAGVSAVADRTAAAALGEGSEVASTSSAGAPGGSREAQQQSSTKRSQADSNARSGTDVGPKVPQANASSKQRLSADASQRSLLMLSSVKSSSRVQVVDADIGLVQAITASHPRYVVRLRAFPLPRDVSGVLYRHQKLLRSLDRRTGTSSATSCASTVALRPKVVQSLRALRARLERAFRECREEPWRSTLPALRECVVDRVWAFGPHRCGPNLLVNNVPLYRDSRPSVWAPLSDASSAVSTSCTPAATREFDASIMNGFDLACTSGPLCGEPLVGVCFVVDEWRCLEAEQTSIAAPGDGQQPTPDSLATATPSLETTTSESGASRPLSKAALPASTTGSLAGALISATRDACALALTSCAAVRALRLLTAVYACRVFSTADCLGRVYDVLNRRWARILREDLQSSLLAGGADEDSEAFSMAGSSLYVVDALLPVAESLGFADELRKHTHGFASPVLQFGGWLLLDSDPTVSAETSRQLNEEVSHADDASVLRARRYVLSVRKRNGLPTDEQIVVRAEKQRTLKKNK